MSRLRHLEPADAQGEARTLLEQTQRQLGMVPNFVKVFANSPATLAAFQGLNGNLHRGALDAKTRERIALVTGEANGCQYCVSAHTALAQRAGLAEGEIHAARRGGSSEARADAAVKFARSLLEHRGDVTTAELRGVRAAGFDDGEIVEIIANVGLNVLTNLLGKAAQIDIDFPAVELLGSAA